MNDKDFIKIARNISLIENEGSGYEALLLPTAAKPAKLIGITGAPGSGKSTLTDALITEMVSDHKKVAILCVDPSSPFHKGALLGDRIRMSQWYNDPDVFIRSFASRGALGGLHPHIIEITEYMLHAGFDYIVVETVGVGQSEVDIAALADITIVLLVPEGGDSVQSMKSGLMEIADIFVVNKSDRPGADVFYNNLKKMLGPVYKGADNRVPVLKTTATEKEGLARLYKFIQDFEPADLSERKVALKVQKVYGLIQAQLMKNIDTAELKERLVKEVKKGRVNLYAFAKEYTTGKPA